MIHFEVSLFMGDDAGMACLIKLRGIIEVQEHLIEAPAFPDLAGDLKDTILRFR